MVFSEDKQKDEKEEEEPLAGKDEEERRIAEMGRPMLGDHVKLEIIIEESYEFKVTGGGNGRRNSHFVLVHVQFNISICFCGVFFTC